MPFSHPRADWPPLPSPPLAVPPRLGQLCLLALAQRASAGNACTAVSSSRSLAYNGNYQYTCSANSLRYISYAMWSDAGLGTFVLAR